MSVYGFSLPFSFVWNKQQSSFSYPSFNQFGISPKYKWITAHFGYRSLRFGEYTLNGHTFLGAGVELTPGKFRFGAMYGKFNQNSDNDPYMADSIPRFTRMGWAAKVGYGTEKSFFDVSMLHVGDNTQNYHPPTHPSDPTPAENLVVGVTSKVSITSKFIFSFDGSISCFTRNVKDPSLIEISGFGTDLLKKLITINLSSTYYTALKTSLAYKFSDKVGAALEYRRIDPEYQSFGAYFCNNDVEMYSVNANANLLKNKLVFKGSLGWQHDNLGNTKKATSSKMVGSFAGTVNFNQNFGIDANYSNFSTNQRSGRSAIIDSLRLFQVNHNFSIMPRFTKVTTTTSHFVLFNFNRMQLDNKNKQSAQQSDTKTTILMANYNIGFLKSGLSLSMGLNYTSLENNMYQGAMYGGSMGLSKALLNNKLSINWNNSYMLNEIGGNESATLNSYLSVNYRPHPKHAFNIGVNYISNKYSDTTTTPSFNETRGEIRYAYSF
jgi:hypothetical protein